MTTNTKNHVPWLTHSDVPEILLDNLVMSKNLHNVKLYAFCILPDHLHLFVHVRENGLSRFMHSLKRNVSVDAKTLMSGGSRTSAARGDITFQKSFHARRITNDHQFDKTLRYVRYNAFFHHLVAHPHNWPWSSLVQNSILDPIDFF